MSICMQHSDWLYHPRFQAYVDALVSAKRCQLSDRSSSQTIWICLSYFFVIMSWPGLK